MTDDELRLYLKDFAKAYCNNTFLILNPDYDPLDPLSEEYIESIPGSVTMFIEKALAFYQKDASVKSESLGDYSVSLETDIPLSLMKLIKPYRRPVFA